MNFDNAVLGDEVPWPLDIFAVHMGRFQVRHGHAPRSILCHPRREQEVVQLMASLDMPLIPIVTENGGVLATEMWLTVSKYGKTETANGQ